MDTPQVHERHEFGEAMEFLPEQNEGTRNNEEFLISMNG